MCAAIVEQRWVGEPWERQPWDGDREWGAFVHYRDLGTARLLDTTTAALSLRRGTVTKWAADGSWKLRAAAYDAMLDREKLRARVDAIRKMEERHAQVAGAAITALAQPIAALQKGRKIAGGNVPRQQDFERMGSDQLVRLAAVAARALAPLVSVERLSRGEPTAITDAHHTVDLPDPVTDEERNTAFVEALIEAGLMPALRELPPPA